MTFLGWLFFNDKDNVIVDEIMNLHKIDKSKKDIVKAHYEQMLKDLREDESVEA